MSVFKTDTPAYRGQPDAQRTTAAPAPNLCDRVTALFRTATPIYQESGNRLDHAPEPEPPALPEPEPPACHTPGVPQAQIGRGYGG